MGKQTAKKILIYTIAVLLAALIIGYGLVCLFFLVIGIVADHVGYFTLGTVGLTGPIAIPVIIHDLKDLFF